MSIFRKSDVNSHLKFCSECKEWYNPEIPSDWVTAHTCPSERFGELNRKIDKLTEIISHLTEKLD